MKEFARTVWCADDLTAIAPWMSERQCEEFLALNEDTISEQMISAGWEIIEDLLAHEH